MKLSPSHRLYGLGAILLVAQMICARNFSRTGERSFFIPLAVAGVAYLLAIRELFSKPEFPKRVIVFGLALSAVWHFQFLRMPSGLDDDIHRYVWDGRMQRLGYNPYIVVPSDSALVGLHTPETRTLNNPEVPSDLAIVFVLLDPAGRGAAARRQSRRDPCPPPQSPAVGRSALSAPT